MVFEKTLWPNIILPMKVKSKKTLALFKFFSSLFFSAHFIYHAKHTMQSWPIYKSDL